MLVGVMDKGWEEISDYALSLLSVALTASAGALESFELYRNLRSLNRDLSSKMAQLEDSRNELERYHVVLEEQVETRTRELAQANDEMKMEIAERMRAGGAGIPAFYTRTGVGTLVAQGKETREFDGHTYIMERSLVPDVSFVKAWKADHSGNLVFRLTARNFNPAVAMAGRICVVEVEEIVETGAMVPDQVHLPGIYVHRIVHNPNPEKRIEKRTITEKAGV